MTNIKCPNYKQFDIATNKELYKAWLRGQEPTDENFEAYLDAFVGIFNSLEAFVDYARGVNDLNPKLNWNEYYYEFLNGDYGYYHADQPAINVHDKQLMPEAYSPIVFIFSHCPTQTTRD